MVTEYRLLNSTSDRTGEIVLRANANKLVERLVYEDSNTIVDPTYIQDFLLTYRVFIDNPTFISNKLYDWFRDTTPNTFPSSHTLNTSTNSIMSTSSSSSPSFNGVNLKKKVYRIVLEWITNHFNDFETNKELYEFVERFQDILNKEKMYEQLRVLTIALSTKSKQRTVTLARSKRDETLMFNIQGGWDKGYGIFVSRIDKDSKAHELGMRKGDQILEVNGHSFQHITLSNALDTLKSFTHSSITLKYNPIGFNEMLLHPEKSPHRNKKSFLNNNKAYLMEYLQMQDNQQISNESSMSLLSKMNTSNSADQIQALNSSNNSSSIQQQKKSIGSIPPLPPSTISNLTPRNKSKDKSHFKLLNSNNITNSSGKRDRFFFKLVIELEIILRA
jgi:hypothetical protein